MINQCHQWELGCTSTERVYLSVSSAILKFQYIPKDMDLLRYNETKTLRLQKLMSITCADNLTLSSHPAP